MVKPFSFLLLCASLTNLSPCLLPSRAFASDQNFNDEQKVLQVIRKHPEVILEAVQKYQQQQREQMQYAKLLLIQSISENPKQYTANSPAMGKSDSKVVLIQFADFQCPYCADVNKTLRRFVSDNNENVSLVYKHYPLIQIHPESMAASTASWAAYQQGMFWQFHDLLYSNQKQLGERLYVRIAKDIGLNLTKFNRDRNSKEARDAIDKDIELAEKLGVSGTPFFIMNGEAFSGAVQKSFLDDVLRRLKRQAKVRS
jgi:protein-disulfide isomerase